MMISIYLHIPFCSRRCAYCDFNTYAGQDGLIPAYVDALRNEINAAARGVERSLGPQAESAVETRLAVHTVFFGGGTPSLLTPSQFESILDALAAHFELLPAAELTFEANPGTVSADGLLRLRRAGMNRISFGMQSANVEELRMLERIHTFVDVIDAVKWARQAGYDNLNLDLIYGLPEQTLARWQTSVERAVALRPEHLSLYALTLEHGTPFGRWASRGLLPLPDPDLAADMYEWSSAFLAANGYIQYEISNWARLTKDESGRMKDEETDANSSFILHPSSFACKHNLQYWRNLDYLGFGAGAHGYAAGIRYSNVIRIKTYIERLNNPQATHLPFPLTPAAVNHHKNSLRDDMQETMITGLRLTSEGVSAAGFHARFGAQLADVFGKEIDELLGLRLLEWSGNALRLSEYGRLLGNQVFMRFVGD
jgi:oxygen-independent coproporphyrinogen-3 oxidase